MKICTKCSVEKPVAEYGVCGREPDGVNRICKACQKRIAAAYYEANKARICARTNAHHQANRDARNAAMRNKYWADPEPKRKKNRAWNKANPAVLRQWELANPDKVRAKGQRWYAENKERHLANGKRRREENPELGAMYRAKRRAAKLERTPTWLTPEDRDAIAHMYLWARAMRDITGVEHHVDHIFPLQGEFVSGLHVPGNLQVLTAYENISKKNTYLPA